MIGGPALVFAVINMSARNERMGFHYKSPAGRSRIDPRAHDVESGGRVKRFQTRERRHFAFAPYQNVDPFGFVCANETELLTVLGHNNQCARP